MPLTLNADDARKGDHVSNVIRESGRYVGVITRAEKLLSRNNVEGVGLSFKADDGATASYLDVYTIRQSDGKKLYGYHLIQALLACLKLRNVEDGSIEAEKWDSTSRAMVRTHMPGYPALMGKRIGVFLQKELSTNRNTGEDSERVNLIGVFDPVTNLTAIEILSGKTEPKRIQEYERVIERNPIVDRRTKSRGPTQTAGTGTSTSNGGGQSDFDDDIPF